MYNISQRHHITSDDQYDSGKQQRQQLLVEINSFPDMMD